VVVYQAPQKKPWLKRAGFLCLSLSLAGFSLLLSPMLTPQMAKEEEKGFSDIIAQEVEPSPRPVVSEEPVRSSPSPEPAVKNFLLTIEKLDLRNIPVQPEIDSANKAVYEQALLNGLVHPQEAYFPGQGKLVYIFGHSANYPWMINALNALFYRADELEKGDRVKLEYNGRHYLYYVSGKQVVFPDELAIIKENLDKDVLILQTCWPAGTVWKRLLIFCEPSKFGGLL